MTWTATRPNIEIAAEWIAAAMLGGAVVLALAMLVPAGMVAAACGGCGAAAAAIALQRSVAPGGGAAVPGFAPADWPGAEEVLLLDAPLAPEASDELLLDDPLPAPDRSRVVRLFGDLPGGEAAAIPAPGEMLARIETFLGASRETAFPAGAAPGNAASAEASAALHAALADIRRSLRQG